ncbi:thioredoxin [Pseudomonas endophytica]|uniref:Thioredoxin n=1 Tax=Pseudomonas endophytica TaxID=1563157 RepID=A0A0Q0SZH1_9PSED|nr:thioredoxin family protein [Pseudomonas endophytica]KQB52445.1 thioredoxin [Pseudomonas endophytica]
MQLTDFDADQRLLSQPGTSLVVFTSTGCSSCRMAHNLLPNLQLPIDQLYWIDAGENGGLVERYEIFHLPALFVVRDGAFYGQLNARLNQGELTRHIKLVLLREPDDLP